MTNTLRFGTVQGRLIQAPPGELQWFPQDHWRSEFFLAASLGIDYIELIAEVQHNPDNPIWTDEGVAEIHALVERNQLSVHALCNDYIVQHSLIDDPAVLQQNLDLIARGKKLGAEKYVLPFFESSEMNTDNVADYLGPLGKIADAAHAAGMITCLETIFTGTELIDLLDKLGRDHVKVVYDTGNRVAFGHDLPGDIRLLGERIAHVHIKDKNTDNANVILGTGLVNFKTVFEALIDIGYDGPYTFETQRGKDPLRTAMYNMTLVDYFQSEASDGL